MSPEEQKLVDAVMKAAEDYGRIDYSKTPGSVVDRCHVNLRNAVKKLDEFRKPPAPRCEPPAKYATAQFHWLIGPIDKHIKTVARYNKCWMIPGSVEWLTPEKAYERGYRWYAVAHEPLDKVEWSDEAIEKLAAKYGLAHLDQYKIIDMVREALRIFKPIPEEFDLSSAEQLFDKHALTIMAHDKGLKARRVLIRDMFQEFMLMFKKPAPTEAQLADYLYKQNGVNGYQDISEIKRAIEHFT